MTPEACGPWNPGVESALPRRLLPLVTLYRADNATGGPAEAFELADLTGLPAEELVAFRPRRLVLHELLVRVTADLSVPDGARVEDLGINFRAMTSTILARYIEPHMAELERAHALLAREMAAIAGAALVSRSADGLEERAAAEKDAAARAILRAAARVAGTVCARHGRPWGEPALLARIATRLAMNEHGSVALGRLIEPFIAAAVRAEGYAVLPAQRQPVVMNTKGASASGKSSMRPLQKALAGEIGAAWSDFALISPDIWRKQLLDYGTLGDAYKYAGSFTGQELRMVDHKLDRYMAAKAERGGMSHLLIDRFRFDSFAAESDEAGSNLLTRFGHFLYLFFMITPPHATVERSWQRGHEVGRYKAVDDLLAHNVEAYTGMPELFFTWALRSDKWVHYEFLDNGVPAGERPLTVAFGLNGELSVLDVKGMLDIERYARINVGASCAAEVYPGGGAAAPGRNTGFLVQCARRLHALNFAERDTGRIYARIEAGALAWTDPPALERALADPETRAGVLAVAPGALGAEVRRGGQLLPGGRAHTLGRWRVA